MNPPDFDRVFDRSAGRAEKYAMRQKLFHTEDILPMWVADMDIATPECVMGAIRRRTEHPILGYEMMPDSAYEAQCDWMHARHGLTLQREWLRYSPSVVAAMHLSIRALSEPGEGVIVQAPVYPPFFQSVTAQQRRLIVNPLRRDRAGRYRFDFDDLERKIDADTRLLLLCSPHNPVGRVWERDELETLAEICCRHDLRIFSDEIHADLIFAPHHHIPTMSLEALRERTITAMGPGKTFNVAGLSISTVVIPDDTLRERFDRLYHGIHFAEGTVFGHAGFEAAYREGAPWLDALMAHLRRNAERLQACINTIDGIAMSPPEATYLAWLDCRGLGMDSDKALRQRFIENARLGLSPGITFGKAGSGYMRLNFAVPTPVMDEALERLQRF